MTKPQILSKKLVKPSTPTPSHLRKVKLSLMDQLVPPTSINIVFCYSSSGQGDSKERSTQLENSLSEALTKFYPLAGRLVIDDLSIDCNDQGVEFLEARVNEKLDDFLHGWTKVEELNHLVPWEDGACNLASTPLVAVQINMFECGGLIVGVRIAHKIADSTSLASFMNGWATASRGGNEDVVSPNFTLGSLFPPSDLIPSNSSTQVGAKIITKRFCFSKKAIRAMEEEVRAASTSGTIPLPSRVVAVSALLWKALIGVARVRHGKLRPSMLVSAVNLRGRTAIPIPENAFGNFPVLLPARFSAEEGRTEIQDLVALLAEMWRDSVTSMAGNSGDLCSMVTRSFSEAREAKLNNPTLDVHLCASWCGVPVYEVDFGWGKPKWVGSSSKPTEVISLMDNGDGIDAWVCLDEKDMAELENSPDMLPFVQQ